MARKRKRQAQEPASVSRLQCIQTQTDDLAVQSKLAAQQAARACIEQQLQVHPDKWKCGCIAVGTASRHPDTECPVHKAAPKHGILCCFSKLQQLLPGCRLVPELPIHSVNGIQGRCFKSGRFTSGADLFSDFAVMTPSGLIYLVEVCGQHHWKNKQDAERDGKKGTVVGGYDLPVAWLWLTAGSTKKGGNKPQYAKWDNSLQQMKQWLEQ